MRVTIDATVSVTVVTAIVISYLQVLYLMLGSSNVTEVITVDIIGETDHTAHPPVPETSHVLTPGFNDLNPYIIIFRILELGINVKYLMPFDALAVLNDTSIYTQLFNQLNG